MKKVFVDVVFVIVLLAAMLMFCGFKTDVPLCSGSHEVSLEAQGRDCAVLEVSTPDQAIFEVTRDEGKSVAVCFTGKLVGSEAEILELLLDAPEGIACSEVRIENKTANDTIIDYSFEIGIPGQVKDGSEFEIALYTFQQGRTDLVRIRLKVSGITKQPQTGDSSMLMLWAMLACLTGAGALLLRRREAN